MKLKVLLIVLLATFFTQIDLGFSANYYPVTEGIYRGPRPEISDLYELKQIGVKTIINIDNDRNNIAWERKTSAELGLNFISVPLSGFWAPSDEDVDKILSLLVDESHYPLFIHCLHGQDRTGLLIGLFRVFQQDVDPAVAYKEMLDMGFHRELIFLDHYFEERTGAGSAEHANVLPVRNEFYGPKALVKLSAIDYHIVN